MKRALYESFYRLKRDPFRLTTDGRFTYSHPTYHKALAFLKYAVYREEGFVMITGRPGTGKTTLINDVISQFDPDEVLIATLVTSQLEAADLLHIVASYFHIHVTSETKSALLLQIEQFLRSRVAAGKRVILIVDEAQGLYRDAVEELRLLSNLVSNNKPMLQIFLVGQQELRGLVKTHDLEQLRQRITAAANLSPLTEEEVSGYIRHRLIASGWSGDPQIENAAIRLIHYYSEGIPRKINLICSRFLLHGAIMELHTLRVSDLVNVLDELKDEFLIFDEGLVPVEEILDLEDGPAGYLEPPGAPPGQTDSRETPAENGSTSAVAEQAPETASAAGPDGGNYANREAERDAGAVQHQPGHAVEAVDAGNARDEGYPAAGAQLQQEAVMENVEQPASPPVMGKPVHPAAAGMQGDLARDAAVGSGATSSVYASGQPPAGDDATAFSAGLRLLFALMGVALLAVAVFLLLRFGSDYLTGQIEKEAVIISDKVAGRVAEMTEYYDSGLARIASEPEIADLLAGGDQAALQAKEAELRTGFPAALDLRLLPAGHGVAETGDGAIAIEAELAQIRLVESGEPAPVVIHGLGTTSQHVNILHRVMGADQETVAGTIVVSLWDEMLQDILGGLEGTDSYIELRQFGDRGVPDILATHGDVSARSGNPGQLLPVKGSRWQIAWWPPASLLWTLRDASLLLQVAIALSVSAALVIIALLFRQDAGVGREPAGAGQEK